MVRHRPLLLATALCILLAGCTVGAGPTPDTPTATPAPAATDPGDEPPLDLVDGPSTLGPDQPPHLVAIVNDGGPERTVVLTVERDGTVVTERTFRSFPNTTILAQLDEAGDYTLTLTVGDETVTKQLAADRFDCNTSRTTFNVTRSTPTVRTLSTEIACGTAAGQ